MNTTSSAGTCTPSLARAAASSPIQPLRSFGCDLEVEFGELLLFLRRAHAALAFQAGRLHGSLGDLDPFIGQSWPRAPRSESPDRLPASPCAAPRAPL